MATNRRQLNFVAIELCANDYIKIRDYIICACKTAASLCANYGVEVSIDVNSATGVGVGTGAWEIGAHYRTTENGSIVEF